MPPVIRADSAGERADDEDKRGNAGYEASGGIKPGGGADIEFRRAGKLLAAQHPSAEGGETSARAWDDGSLTARAKTLASLGEGGAEEVAATLVYRINESRAIGGEIPWGAPRFVNSQVRGHTDARQREHGIDCEAHLATVQCMRLPCTTHAPLLRIQVTRVPPSGEVWKELSHTGLARISSRDFEAAAHTLMEAVRRKAYRQQHLLPEAQRVELTLALDAGRFEYFAFEGTIAAFRRLYGAEADGLGFAAIWVVGAVPGRTQRLDESA